MTRRAVDLASFLGGALLAAAIIAAGIAATPLRRYVG